MRLCLIYNVWNDFDLLDHSVRIMEDLVDGVIVVVSSRSNFGEVSPIPERWLGRVVFREPKFNIPMHSETDKRNFGLEIARKAGYTHFLTIDADEVYESEPFLKAKELFKNSNLKGLVCPCNVFFKSPTLTVGRDITLVPFIHKIEPNLRFEFNRSYPFAWSGKQIRIDPTRSMNINSGVEYTEDVVMWHYSWVRSNIDVKIRNSTARTNIERSSLREDYRLAKEGYYCNYYGKILTKCENVFGIPELGVSEPSVNTL